MLLIDELSLFSRSTIQDFYRTFWIKPLLYPSNNVFLFCFEMGFLYISQIGLKPSIEARLGLNLLWFFSSPFSCWNYKHVLCHYFFLDLKPGHNDKNKDRIYGDNGLKLIELRPFWHSATSLHDSSHPSLRTNLTDALSSADMNSLATPWAAYRQGCRFLLIPVALIRSRSQLMTFSTGHQPPFSL